jgi:hypothetical protein
MRGIVPDALISHDGDRAPPDFEAALDDEAAKP